MPQSVQRHQCAQSLASAGMPSWMRITPTVKEMALRLWLGEAVHVFTLGIGGVRRAVVYEPDWIKVA